MDTPAWKMTPLGGMTPGSCFLYMDESGKHVALALQPEGKSWVVLHSDPPGTAPIGLLMSVRHDYPPSWGLELEGLEADIPELSSICPNARSAEDLQLWKPGALVIAEVDYYVLTINKQDQILAAGLRDGKFDTISPDKQMAVVSCWRLIHRIGKDIREICRIDVGA